MQDNIWRYGLQLESISLVKNLFKKIHRRDLNTTRAKQIVASYLQAKEYYQNARLSNISVKPLLLYYGVSSLSRCLTLLLRRNGGEETLYKGHGLSSDSWSDLLDTNVENSLRNIGNLNVTTTNGLFVELLEATTNKSYLHINSSAVDYHVDYITPVLPTSVSFDDILSRIPDLKDEYLLWSGQESLIMSVSNLEVAATHRFKLKLVKNKRTDEILDYSNGRLEINEINKTLIEVIGEFEDIPMLVNSFVHKTFGSIPSLFAAKPIDSFGEIAQIPLTFLLSYYLGMLCRYFPSHWVSIGRGNIRDEVWPLMQTSMNCIEYSFPELIMEFIKETSKEHS